MIISKVRASKYRRIILWSICFSYLVLFIYLFHIRKEPLVGIDFSLFYAAGKMTKEGIASDIYDIMKHHQVIEAILGFDVSFHLVWLYPPIFLLFIVPFVAMPFRLAATLWVILGSVLYIYTLDKLCENRKVFYIGLLYPSVLINMKWAQNGFMLVFLLGFALHFIHKDPRISGILFALLCFKPHFALLAIVVLILSKMENCCLGDNFSPCFSDFKRGPIWLRYLDSLL